MFSYVDPAGAISYTYDADSNLTQQNNVNGTRVKFSYDASGQVTEVKHERSNGTIFGYFSYGYNSDGLVSDVVEVNGSVVTYNYDAVFRLISEQRQLTYPYTVSYGYNAAGNRLTKVWNGQQTSYQYNSADRLLRYIKPDGSQVNYGWDANGNMVSRTEGTNTSQFDYDYDNRLVKITYPDGSVIQFGYDGLGRRVWRRDSLGTRYFFYDGDRIIAEREGNSWVIRHLVSLSPLPPVGFADGGLVRVYYSDRLGSVRWVTDANQNILVSYIYEGFGKVIAQNGGGGGPYQFCGLWGYRNDHDAGLLHVGARYYEPETGRFIQADPLWGTVFHPASLNRYVYVENDPINYVDPTGLSELRQIILCIILALFPGEGPTGRPVPGKGEYVQRIERIRRAKEAEEKLKSGFPPAAGGPAAIFIPVAGYAAEKFWEGREETGGIIHSVIAARSGVLDLWTD